MGFPDKKFLILNGILLAILFGHSIHRDIMLERQYPSDLRNRVVGARLQQNGILPYDYSWKTGDGIRYFDIQNGNNGSGPSNITASPFFHELFSPLAYLPQRTISRIWLWLQYFFLACLFVMISSLTGDKKIKWLLLNFCILFTVTEAWKDLIAVGQLYMFEGFLMCSILFLLLRNKKTTIIFAGLTTAVFVLTRPIGIVFFIPFLFYYKKYLLFLGSAFAALGIYGIFVLSSPYEKALYRNYAQNMERHVQVHQQVNEQSSATITPKISPYTNMEGFDMNEVSYLNKKYPIPFYSENGNIFVLYNKITHSKLSLAALYNFSLATVFLLCIFFFFHIRKHPAQDLSVILFGFTLYMIVELFSPVYRHQYNTVQWFPLILAALLLIRGWNNLFFLIIFLGLLLNISNISWLPLQHTGGEYIWLTSLLLLIFSGSQNMIVWKKQS